MTTDPRFQQFLQLLLEKNQQVNLTAARSLDALTDRHLNDCLQLLNVPRFPERGLLLDVGTGGGFPGIPIAIARPELQVTLLDSTAKKIAAVNGFIQGLGLTNATGLVGRAEELGHDFGYRGQFDAVTSRAFASLVELLEYTAAFLKPGGLLFSFKGPDASFELDQAAGAMSQLGLPLRGRHPYEVEGRPFEILVFELQKPVPRRFPRSNNDIKRHPLRM